MNNCKPSGLGDTLANARKAPEPPQLDPADFADDLAEFLLTEEQERAFLETLWSIMRRFAEMGVSVDLCGQLFGEFNEAAETAPIVVESGHSTKLEKPSGPAGKESES